MGPVERVRSRFRRPSKDGAQFADGLGQWELEVRGREVKHLCTGFVLNSYKTEWPCGGGEAVLAGR